MLKDWEQMSREDKLKFYKLDKESIDEFRSKIRKISVSERDKVTNKFIASFNDCLVKEYDGRTICNILEPLIFDGAYVNSLKSIPLLKYDNIYEQVKALLVRDNMEDVLALLLRAGINLNFGFNIHNYFVKTINSNHIKYTELLLLMGGNPNVMDRTKHLVSPIAVACCNGREDFVRLLLSYDADPRLSNSFGYDAYSMASEHLISILDEEIKDNNQTSDDIFKENCKKLRRIFGK